MEEDFKVFSEEEIGDIKKYQIPYKWRDSCVEDLINWKRCQEYYPFSNIAMCIGFKNQWQNCQFKRERSIIAAENLAPVPEERRRMSY